LLLRAGGRESEGKRQERGFAVSGVNWARGYTATLEILE